MILPENCKETFLDGVTDAYFYPTDGSVLFAPFSVAQILQMNNCQFAPAVLHIATAGEEYVLADSITAKVTPNIAANGTVYSFEISANITDGGQNVCEAYKKMRDNTYYIVLRKQDGSLYLCYTLPGTFVFKTATSVTTSDEQRTVTTSLQAMSDFIPITLKQ